MTTIAIASQGKGTSFANDSEIGLKHQSDLRELGLEIKRLEFPSEMSEAEMCEQLKGIEHLMLSTSPILSEETIKILAAAGLVSIHRNGVGINDEMALAAARNGVPAYVTPGVLNLPVAEHALGLIVDALQKKTKEAITLQAAILKGEVKLPNIQKQPLSGNTVGIVGIGAIGSILAERMAALNNEIVFYDTFLPEKRRAELVNLGYRSVDTIDELAADSNIVPFHIPDVGENVGIIDRLLPKLNPGTLVVNTARGGLLTDEQAMVAAYEEKGIVYAADVSKVEPFNLKENPLAAKVISGDFLMTPHKAPNDGETPKKVGDMIVAQVASHITDSGKGKILESNLAACIVQQPEALEQLLAKF